MSGNNRLLNMRKLIKYAVVGVVGTLVHWGILIGLVEGFGTEPVYATSIGFIATVILSFYLNLYWTFSIRAHSAGIAGRWVRYVLVSVGGLLLNSGLMYVAVHLLNYGYLFGQSVSLIAVPVFNYVLHSIWTFRTTDSTRI
ncbi:GtrA family protein [Cohnella laeviribosi]|uniref:GtrA family protein n=1 Tax=Cohnella laeviribosi TaxID=380174 RepID=UPI0003671808|nr:GtrA family protein [Cohnella laeviribosi]